MQRSTGVPARPKLVRGGIAVAVLGGVLAIAGCSSAQSGGTLQDEVDTAELTANTATAPSPTGSAQSPSDADESSSEGQGSGQGSAVVRQQRQISAERTQLVTDAIKRDATSLGFTELHSVRVQSEDPTVSLALVVATRNNSKRVYGVAVVKRADNWVVANVDTLPDGQYLK